MSKLGWLTPDNAPSGVRCVQLFVPQGDEWEQAVRGALLPLTFASAWEKAGGYSPQDAAAEFEYPLYLTFRWRACRMIGEIIVFAGADTPEFCLPCDGTSYSAEDYPELFAVIGTTYGDPGGGNFRVPDLRGRAAIGAGQGSGLTQRDLADIGGVETVTLNEQQMPSHTHSVHDHAVPAVSGELAIPVSTPGITATVTGSTGADQAHENMPPFLALNYYIFAGI